MNRSKRLSPSSRKRLRRESAPFAWAKRQEAGRALPSYERPAEKSSWLLREARLLGECGRAPLLPEALPGQEGRRPAVQRSFALWPPRLGVVGARSGGAASFPAWP